MKKIIIPVMIFVIVLLLVLCIYIIKKNNTFTTKDKTNNLTTEMKTDAYLTEKLGYNIEDSSIYKILYNKDSNCICVVLDDEVQKFINSDLIRNKALVSDENGVYFSDLKKLFPKTFDMDFWDIKNNQGTMKDGIAGKWVKPYSIYWFSADIDGEERIAIYAFLPTE